jgi:hypothetical protein
MLAWPVGDLAVNLVPELERSRYPLPSLAASEADAAFATRAVFSGFAVCALPPRVQVEALLPGELALAGVGDGPSARHPLVFVFGEQTRCAMVVGGVDVERDVAYQELAVLVPFVTHRRVRQLCVFVPGMLSSYYLSNWTGLVHYGYGKRLGHLHATPPVHAVTTPEHGLAFQALIGEAGPWLRAEQAGATALPAIRAIASLPWVGRKPTGAFARSFSDWRFAGAQVRSVRARCSVHAPVAGALASGEYPVPDGCGLEVRGMTWWLSWPQPCPY